MIYGSEMNRGGGLRGLWIGLVFAVAVASRGWAGIPDMAACGAAGRAAEYQGQVPANLLISIGMVESGRVDPGSGRVAPWPWTVNVDGTGQYFETKADAEAFVRLAQTSGARDVDVGCFQVSLQEHPDAFGSLDEAFDPVANAQYAAGYLNRLKGQTGSWNVAIADYHSQEPDLGLPYQRRVLAAWHGLGALPAGIAPLGYDDVRFAPRDPVVIMQTAAARRVHVYTMDDPPGAGLRSGLPRVITP
jgi:hypothetical protein